MGLLYLYCTDVCERPDSPSGCFTGYLFDKGRSGAHSRSVYCLALASRRTVLPWPVAILSCPGQSPYSRPNHRAAYCLTKDKRLTCDSATVGVGIHQRTAGKCGTQWCGRLRHCATSRKVAGSIPDGVIEVIH